jgi:tRNA-splicing ligase RtcB (3'-phosphate/5'-hydroxy nucleic acid ligase)
VDEFDRLEQLGDVEWLLPAHDGMRVPGRIYADRVTMEQLRRETSDESQWSALRQVKYVACMPGIVSAALALPDVHPGYGFPIGGVGAFDLDEGVAVVGGVGFDINCGVRVLRTPLGRAQVAADVERIGADLFRTVPAGLGSSGSLRLTVDEIDRLLEAGAAYVVERGYGLAEDLEYTEEGGRIDGADPAAVSVLAKQREFKQVGTLGSGNHYLELQFVERVLDPIAAAAYGLREEQVLVAIHTGSRALGHQIGQDYLKELGAASARYRIAIPDQEMVCAPIRSPEGARYLAAVAAGSNCAFANRQVIAHLVRTSLARTCGLAPKDVPTMYDIGHNNAKFEDHSVDGKRRRLLVHRKGATRAFGPGREEAPPAYRGVGHPIFVGGTMGTASYILRGTELGMEKAFGSGIHGAGRALSRKKAAKKYWGEDVMASLRASGTRVWAHDARGVAEEAPGAYKDVEGVVAAAAASGLNRAVARLRPLAVIKG